MTNFHGNLGGDTPEKEFKETVYIPSNQPNCIFMSPNRPDSAVNRSRAEKLAEEVKEEAKALDVQVGGDHYKRFVIQPVEFCQKNKLDTCQSNVIKYVCRHNFKDGLKDLQKAKHYIDLLIQMEYGDVKDQGVPTK